MKKPLLLILGISSIVTIASCSIAATSNQTATKSNSAPAAEVKLAAANQSFDYQDYAEVLETYVNDQGRVNYTALQANREQLDSFIQSVGAVPRATYAAWSKDEKIAFLINAYNAFTLQSIIDQEPLEESIKDISGVWNKRKFNVAGEQKTLNNIEHDTLRKDFNEPRIHVALVCAAKSCPILRNEPYLGAPLDAQLTDQTAKFTSSSQGFSIDQQDNTVYLSSIFKWYGKDFIDSYGVDNKFDGNDKQRATLNYLSTQLDPQQRQFLEQSEYDVKYLDYDWSLNKQ